MENDIVTHSGRRPSSHAALRPSSRPRPRSCHMVDPLRPDDFALTSLLPRPAADPEPSISQVTMDAIVAASLARKADTSETSLELRRDLVTEVPPDERGRTAAPSPGSFVGRWIGDVYIGGVREIVGDRLVLIGHVADGTPRRLVVLPAELGDEQAAAVMREVLELSSRARLPCPRPLAHGRVDGCLWVSYAHEEGRLLSEVIAGRRLSERQAVALALELVDMVIDALSIDAALGAPFAGRDWPLAQDAVVLSSDGRISTQAMWAGTWATEGRPMGELQLRGQLDIWLATIAEAAPPRALGPVAPSRVPPSLEQLRAQLAKRLVQLRSPRQSPRPTGGRHAPEGVTGTKRSQLVSALSLAMVVLSVGITAAALLGLR